MGLVSDCEEEFRGRFGELKCSFCGEKPEAYWHEMQTVFVCRSCAVKILPRLIADAVYPPSIDLAAQTLDKVLKEFYHGLAFRLEAQLRKATRK